jgi:hypothetical protein
MLEEFLDGKPYVRCDLAEQRGGDITASMERHCGAAPICMPVLPMRAALPNLCESEPLENGYNFPAV